MDPSDEKRKVSRRTFVGIVGAFGGALGFTGGAWASNKSALAQTQASLAQTEASLAQSETSRDALLKIFTEKKVGVGGGILVMSMPGLARNPNVPLRAAFAFGPDYFIFDIETNSERFLLHTAELGDLVIDPNSFTLSLAGTDTQATFGVAQDGLAQAILVGEGGCGVSGTSSDSKIGGKDLKESVKYEATAVDGGRAVPDRFSVKVTVDRVTAPTLYSIFGQEEIFTGEILSGKIVVKQLSQLPF